MTPAILLQKLREFVKSVLPVDVGQTALLFGAVLMLSIPHMRSWFSWLLRLAGVEGAATATHISRLLTYPLYLIYVAGAVALWVALIQVSKPQLWLRVGVFAPFWTGLMLNLVLGWHFQNRFSSVPVVEGSRFAEYFAIRQIAGRLPGHTLSVALIAWLMILIADKRLSAGTTILPVRFPTETGDIPGAAQPSAKLIWSTLVITTLAANLLSACIAAIIPYSQSGAAREVEWPQSAIWSVGWGIEFAAIVWFASGRDRLATLSRSLRPPHLKWLVLSIIFPVAVLSAWPLAGFFVYRVRGPAHYPPDYPPSLADHFPTFQWILLFAIVSALAEEIAWRGYLQPRFIRRFGLYRGIFLVGIVWGAFHFPWNFSGRSNLWLFSVATADRLVGTVSLGFVLSWLTLKAKSVIPAGIAHGLMNALYHANWEGKTSYWIIYGLWGVLAFALFRFWPPEVEDEEVTNAPHDDELEGAGGVAESPA
jgi:membrane protease YdiL (CAAX protease family)